MTIWLELNRLVCMRSGRIVQKFLLLVVLLAPSVLAQEAEVRLVIERDRVGADETLIVEVTVLGTARGALEPELALNGNFEILGRTKRHSVSLVNGETIVEARFEFVTRPLQAGVFDVGPAVVRWDGGRLVSGTQRVEVLPASSRGAGARDPASAPARGGPDPLSTFAREPTAAAIAKNGKIHLLATLSDDVVFVGERVTYSLELLTQRRVSGVHPRSEPQFTGFWSVPTEVAAPPKRRKRTFRGEEYDAYLLRQVELYPASAGAVAIEPAVWDVTVVVPDILFSDTEQLVRSTQPVALTVEALPEAGRPPDFSGAVGSYAIESRLDRQAAVVGEALTLTATIRGDGNLAALPRPSLPAMPDFRAYDTRPHAAAGSVGRSWETTLVARAPGDHTIPALEYPYFDPATREYRLARSQPLTVAIAKPATEVTAAAAPDVAPLPPPPLPAGAATVSIETTAIDLAVRPASPRGRGLVAVMLLPIALNLSALAVLGVRRSRAVGTDERRRGTAYRTARRRLDEAAKLHRHGPPGAVAGEVAGAIVGYFADRFGEPGAGLSRDRLRGLCSEHGAGGASDGIGRLLDRIDLYRFTPTAASAAQLAALVREARGRLRALDRAVGAGKEERP